MVVTVVVLELIHMLSSVSPVMVEIIVESSVSSRGSHVWSMHISSSSSVIIVIGFTSWFDLCWVSWAKV